MFDPHFDCIICGYLMLYHVISCYITLYIIYIFIYLFIFIFIYLYIDIYYLYIFYIYIYLFIDLSIYLFIYPSLYIYIYIDFHYFHYYPFIWGIHWLGLRTDASSRPLWPEDVHPHHQKWPKSSPIYIYIHIYIYGKIWKNMEEYGGIW